ncbi:MAG: transglycosylase SLT domain-containing protein [Nitrospiraceae bacterium]
MNRIGLCFWSTLVCFALVLLLPTVVNPDGESRPRHSKQEIRRAISFYAQRYRLEPALLRAVIKAESDFRPEAVSHKGAVGLMQLMPATAAHLRVTDPYDPIQNIRGGARQLRHLLVVYDGNVSMAVAAYNAGTHRVKGGKIPRIRETRLYVRKVLRYYRDFKFRERVEQREQSKNRLVPRVRPQLKSPPAAA